MAVKITTLILLSLLLGSGAESQNVGIGTILPTEKLEVNGNVKAGGLIVTQGNEYDVAKKGASGEFVFSKGSKGVGINYIIAVEGLYPIPGGPLSYSNIIMGEIRLFAGNFAPKGFMFCNGQLMSINNNLSLISLIGTTY